MYVYLLIDEIVEKEKLAMQEIIKEHWNDILNILNRDYDISLPVINAWIRPLKIYKIDF